MDFEQALIAVSKKFSTNPSELTGLSGKGYGSIIDGAKADLCILDIAGSQGDYKTAVTSTIVNGEIVYSAL